MKDIRNFVLEKKKVSRLAYFSFVANFTGISPPQRFEL